MKASIFFLFFALCITLSAASIPSTIAEEEFTAAAKKLTSSVHTGKPYGGHGHGRGHSDNASDSDDDSKARGRGHNDSGSDSGNDSKARGRGHNDNGSDSDDDSRARDRGHNDSGSDSGDDSKARGRGHTNSDSDRDDIGKGHGKLRITRRSGNRCGAAHSSLRKKCRSCNRGCVRRFGSNSVKGYIHATTMDSAVHYGVNWKGGNDGTDDDRKRRGKGSKRHCKTRQCRVCRRACRKRFGRRTVIVKHNRMGGNRGGYKH